MWTNWLSETNWKYLSWVLQAVGIVLIFYGFIFEQSLYRAIVIMALGAILGFAGGYIGSRTEQVQLPPG